MRRRLTIGVIAGLIVIWIALWAVVSVAAWVSPSRDVVPVFGIAILAGLMARLGGATLVVVLLLALPVSRLRCRCASPSDGACELLRTRTRYFRVRSRPHVVALPGRDTPRTAPDRRTMWVMRKLSPAGVLIEDARSLWSCLTTMEDVS
jgi:hypothetical protein